MKDSSSKNRRPDDIVRVALVIAIGLITLMLAQVAFRDAFLWLVNAEAEVLIGVTGWWGMFGVMFGLLARDAINTLDQEYVNGNQLKKLQRSAIAYRDIILVGAIGIVAVFATVIIFYRGGTSEAVRLPYDTGLFILGMMFYAFYSLLYDKIVWMKVYKDEEDIDK